MGVVWSSLLPSSLMEREKEGWRQLEGGGGTEREAFLCKRWDLVAHWPSQSCRLAWGPSTRSGFQKGLAASGSCYFLALLIRHHTSDSPLVPWRLE